MTASANTDLLTLADAGEEEANHRRALELGPMLPNALDLLYQALGDKSWRVRKAALVALERFRNEGKLVETLISGLGSQDNAGLRNACAEGLVMLGERAVPGLVQALRTVDLDQRKFVIEALGLIGTKQALESLLAALAQDDANVRAAVVDALGQIGGPQVADELKRRLADKPGDLQYAVYILDALARCGAQLTWLELNTWLAHKQLARFVYPLLGLSKDVASVPALISAVSQGTRSTRRLALPALAKLWRGLGPPSESILIHLMRGEAQMLPALTAALQDEDEAVVEASVRLFGLCDAIAMAPEILRVCSARGLEHIGIESVARQGSAVVGPLLESLDRIDVQAQLLFLDAIETAGGGAAVPALLELTASDSLHVASAAVRVVGNLGEPEVIEPLMAIIRQRDELELTQQAMFALVHMGVRYPAPVAEHMRRALQVGDVQSAWFSVLGSLRRAEDADVFVSGARHRDPLVRRAAVEAAQRLGSLIPETCLLTALTDESPAVRVAAARGLSAYRSEPTLTALLEAMHDLDPWVVAEAARSLGMLGGRRATQALHQAASSSVAPIAIAVLQGLSQLDTAGLEGALRKALQHSEPEVVREALRVAVRLEKPFAAEVLGAALKHSAWDVRSSAADLLLTSPVQVARSLVNDAYEQEVEPLVREKLGKLRVMMGALR